MFGTIRNTVLALGCLAGLAASANAQYLPSPPGIPVSPYRYFTGQVMVNNLGQMYSLGYTMTTPMGYRYTYLPSTGYNPVYASQSKALRDARRNTFGDTAERQDLTARTNEPKAERTTEEWFAGLPTAFKTAVTSPASADIAGGKALNDLLVTAIDLEKRGSRATGSFLSPEIASSLRFTGNANADLSNWVRAGEIEFPAVFRGEEYAIPRAWLKHDFGTVATSLASGKMPDSSLYQGLMTTGRTMRRTFESRKSQLSASEIKSGEQFLTRFDAVNGIVRSPTSVDLCSSEWARLGVSVVELVDNMSKFKMQFAPAPANQDSAYEAIHQALASYAMSLVETRR